MISMKEFEAGNSERKILAHRIVASAKSFGFSAVDMELVTEGEGTSEVWLITAQKICNAHVVRLEK